MEIDHVKELEIVNATNFSDAFYEGERRIGRQNQIVRHIEEDRRRYGDNDPEREIAHARALGALYGYLFRDAELYHEETGIPIPRKR